MSSRLPGLRVSASAICSRGPLRIPKTSSRRRSLEVAPGLACGDEQCVIAYGTLNGDVHGIAFEIDSFGSPETFTIATTERKEHQPLVHFLGSGRFLVSYLSDQTTDLRINGRIVTFGSTRRRSMR